MGGCKLLGVGAGKWPCILGQEQDALLKAEPALILPPHQINYIFFKVRVSFSSYWWVNRGPGQESELNTWETSALLAGLSLREPRDSGSSFIFRVNLFPQGMGPGPLADSLAVVRRTRSTWAISRAPMTAAKLNMLPIVPRNSAASWMVLCSSAARSSAEPVQPRISTASMMDMVWNL